MPGALRRCLVCTLAALTLAGCTVATARRVSPAGFSFNLPPGWRRDPEAPPVVTRLLGLGAELEIFDQPLSGGDAQTYVDYSHRSVLAGWSGLKLLADRREQVGEYPARVLEWTRPPLARLPDDRNWYYEVAVQPGEACVHTFLLKSSGPARERAITDLRALLASLKWGPSPYPPASPSPPRLAAPGALSGGGTSPSLNGSGREWREAFARGSLRWEPPERGVLWGLFDPLLTPGQWQLARLQEYERSLQTKFGFVMTYQSFSRQSFPSAELRESARDGRLVMLTLQSWQQVEAERVYREPATLTLRVLDGEFDDFLHAYARAARDLKEPFFFRFDNEMNADWSPWGAFQYGTDTALYRAAWRYVWGIFRQEGATNAIFVWNPNDRAYPDYLWNHATMYWPGASYVDWVGLTGYNVGDAYAPNQWRSFHDAYATAYSEYRRLFPNKPLMITEFASHTGPGDKAAWIRQITPELAESFPAIKIAVWWNGTDGRRRYRLDTSPATRTAFVDLLHSAYACNGVWRQTR